MFQAVYWFAHSRYSVVPFELVKIRLQDKASAGKYNGIADVVVKTVRSEGLLAMYQGLESTMWRHILWNAGYFGCISQVRSTLPKAGSKRAQIVNDIVAGSTLSSYGQSCSQSIPAADPEQPLEVPSGRS